LAPPRFAPARFAEDRLLLRFFDLPPLFVAMSSSSQEGSPR
jgi:hypothetical protein